MSLAPGGFGYDAACVVFVEGSCCEGVEKAGNLKQPLLGVCKGLLFDANSPGKPLGLLCPLPLLCRAVLRGFLLAGLSPPVLTWSVSQHCGLQRLTLLKLGMPKSLCISPAVAEGLFRSQNLCWAFLGSFSQVSSLVLLPLLEDSVVCSLIKGKATKIQNGG